MSTLSSKGGVVQAPIDRRKLLLSGAAVIVSVGLLAYVVIRATLFSAPDPGDVSRYRTVLDAETGELVRDFYVKDGTLYPWVNPKTGKATLFPPELCFWTKDGKAKTEPTYVLLNELAGKPGKTICPDCGREVVGHNPKPPMDLMLEAYKARAAAQKK